MNVRVKDITMLSFDMNVRVKDITMLSFHRIYMSDIAEIKLCTLRQNSTCED